VLPDATSVRAVVDSPLLLGGLLDPQTVLVDPARLAWGLARACRELGVEIYESSVVRTLRADRDGLVLTTGSGRVLADQVALATNAFPALLRRTRLHTVPVYDYAIVTEPLTPEQKKAVGWAARHGLADLSHRFHYVRLTPDDRILYGGYDAVYHFGRSMGAVHDVDDDVFARLTAHLVATFPQLDGIRVTHAWGGAIDTCNRFFAFYARGYSGRVVQATGFTGLGVAATRFAADVMLDLLDRATDGTETVRTRLGIVRRSPLPFPPEPVAWMGVRATTAALAQSDRSEGRRGLWLRTLDRFKLGFDS
jgi:glycine/D-amino acid oxidase-like deaminating enzyme